ncbi:hypothetical protein DAI22_01g481700 [Oryza sativa Japonica Group]|nr:hypothetical protein DAI22_01g481700 [Oryza sativa Japonica Group]
MGYKKHQFPLQYTHLFLIVRSSHPTIHIASWINTGISTRISIRLTLPRLFPAHVVKSCAAPSLLLQTATGRPPTLPTPLPVSAPPPDAPPHTAPLPPNAPHPPDAPPHRHRQRRLPLGPARRVA